MTPPGLMRPFTIRRSVGRAETSHVPNPATVSQRSGFTDAIVLAATKGIGVPEVTERRHDLRHMRFDSEAVTLRAEVVMKGTYRIAREVVIVVTLALVVFSPGALTLFAQAPPQAGPPGGLPDLIGMLKATPGVLGVDAAQTISGKQVIFAWFENKKAALAWYYSEGHQKLVKTFAAGGNAGRTPMADVPDDGNPILAIASITLSKQPQVSGVQLPVSQIAIELYAPLPGGLAAGGRFAPSSVKVKNLLEVPLSR
jgi:hypothetical protein